MKNIFIVLFFLLSFTAVSGQTAHHHVVLQLSTNDTMAWKGVVGNVKHLKEKWGNDLEVEVVAHGNGLEMLLTNKTTQAEAINALAKQGVVFSACENTIRMRNINKSDILPVAGFVPSGVVEIVMKEEAGWSYLKAGF